MPRTHLLTTFSLALAVSPIACAHGAESLVKSGVEGGVAGGLEGLNDPRNKELLLRLLRDPEIQQAAHDLTAALTGGAIDGLTDDERQEHVRAVSDAYIRTVAAAVGRAVEEDISPATTRAVRSVVGEAVAAALRPENRELAQRMVDGVTRSAVTALTQSSAQGLRDDLAPALTEALGPALQRVLEDNLGPAMRTILERDLQPMLHAAFAGEDGGATGEVLRALTRQIVLGVNDGMSDLGIAVGPSKNGLGLTGWLMIVFAALLLVTTILVIRLVVTRRRLARERARSDEVLLNFVRALRASEADAADPQAELDAVLARVYQRMPDQTNDSAYLASILGRAQLPRRGEAVRVERRPADR